ncbi:response regulator [Desulfosporosinus sp. PR]|uniref:response regulator n=1 Tax=Candidatus Desulfosporosinus nitrosoreducens TaxID=3401928 RepID=UPI0027F969D3|nr:response regulator [Desulfosporosinus sp. PR]MDQ7092361.1 response regulator [Desulfosporosinus sp. PR]
MSQYILVVDDHFAIRLFIQRALEESGYSVTTAASGSECLSIATSVHRPSLILLDQSMPGMSGLQVLSRLEQDERARDIPVIMITAEEDLEPVVRRFGVRDILNKPLDLEVLLKAIDSVFEDGAWKNAMAE